MKNVFSIFFLIVFSVFNSFAQTTALPDGSLEFDATKQHHVNHGIFWKPGVNHGVFFWEAWVKPYANAEYVISDGYGGAHALLFGFSGGTSRLTLAGNMWSSAANSGISFGTDETVPVNQWCHIAVGWDGQKIVTFINGIPSSVVPYSGLRITPVNSGSGVLFIGGSDHSNFRGKIARVRGFEGVLPMDSLLSAFTPEKYFRSTYLRSDGEIITASFLADYSMPAKTYPDLSLGYRGANHIGLLSRDVDIGFFGYKADFSANLPAWTSEPVTTPVYAAQPITIPTGAIVYDSFNRTDSAPAFGSTGLGIADKSFDDSKAARKWRGTFVNQWGIFGERALNLGQTPNPVWLETGSADMDVRVVRTIGPYSSGNIELIYRYQNDLNYGLVYVGPEQVYLVEYVNGVAVLVRTGVHSQNWTVFRIVANQNNLTVYCGPTQVMSTSSTNLLTGTKAGIKGNVETAERVDEFAVFPANQNRRSTVKSK